MSFLSRLIRVAPEPMVDSVVRNLHSVFNSKKGYASVVESFGLGAYAGTSSTTSLLDTLMAEILAAVGAFEPRVEDPTLALEGRDRHLWVRFGLRGRIEGVERLLYIEIDSKYRNVHVWQES